MSDNPSERAPLLGAHRDAATEWEFGGVPAALLHRPFVLATTASLIAGTLTIVFLIASMIIVSYRPRDYYPPYELNYYFASTAVWVRASPIPHSSLLNMAPSLVTNFATPVHHSDDSLLLHLDPDQGW
jgi:hypothetical protein